MNLFRSSDSVIQSRNYGYAPLFLALGVSMALCFSCTKDNPQIVPEPSVHVHNLVHVEAQSHTETQNGCLEHWVCTSCGDTFADSEGVSEIPMVIDWAENAIICPEHLLLAFDKSGDTFAALGSSMGFEDKTNSSFASSLIASIIVKSLFEIMDRAFEYTHTKEEDPSGKVIYVINEKFMEVMQKLGDVQRSIDALSDHIKNQTFKNAMQRRYEEQIALYNATDATLRQIIRICGNKRFSELSDQELEDVATLLNMWYLSPVKGNNVINEVMNMLDASLMTFDTGSSYPEIYDKVAYQAYAFEHLGYDMREAARCVDALTIVESYIMSCLWFQLHGGDKLFSERHKSLNDKLESYAKILEAHQVTRQTEYTVSQVQGFHQGRKLSLAFKNAKDPYPYFNERKDNFDWRRFSGENYKNTENIVKFKNFSEGLYRYMCGDDELAMREEYRALWEFYGGKKSISKIFEDAGFTCTHFILATDRVDDFHWHHFQYRGLRMNESGRRYDFFFDMIESDGTCPGSNIFVGSCFYDPDNGHLTLASPQTVTYSYPEWWLF